MGSSESSLPPVTLDQVLGLVKYVNAIGGRVDSSRLDEMLNVDMNLLPHVVKAAVLLGLLKEEGGDLSITEEGLAAMTLSGRALRELIRELSSRVEPFKDILALARENSISRDDLVKVLRGLGYSNVDVAADIFTEWLAYMGVAVTE